eukprot:TRINITY_DN10534_c0_g1_i1.p1 TRINITY_DN10534_c0_g1~~TRINITY_DN10534_c0_g1_i1.p1  ORF type:complete len:280 (-),score=29.93 TRINITY_DN10534_c0_g1_i1:173-982(-)
MDDHLLPNPNAVHVKLPSLDEVDTFARKVSCATPFLIGSLIPFYMMFVLLAKRASEPHAGTTIEALPWDLVGFGAAGWWIALVLRMPVLACAKACSNDEDVTSLRNVSVLISGPAEEGVRTAMLFLFAWARSCEKTFALGLGWTSIEVLFTIVQAFAMVKLLRAAVAGDPEAAKGFQLLAAQSGRDDPLTLHPAWGVLERCGAHALHLALGLFAAFSPWMVIATSCLHSFCNWSVVTLFPKLGPCVVELGFLFASLCLLLGAVGMWGLL